MEFLTRTYLVNADSAIISITKYWELSHGDELIRVSKHRSYSSDRNWEPARVFCGSTSRIRTPGAARVFANTILEAVDAARELDAEYESTE